MQSKTASKKNLFLAGLKEGFPIGAGYFAVAFSLGIMAKKIGLTPFQGFISSLLTNASAGEYAAFMVILEDAGLIEMILVTLVASGRYFLMSCALSQHIPENVSIKERALIAFYLTDETFGVQVGWQDLVKPIRSYGLFILPLIGWSTGTLLGVVVGSLLPADVVAALSVSLYGMFLAIIVPPAKKDKVVFGCIVVSFGLSYLCSKLPATMDLSSGNKTIILTVLIASIAAFLFPVKADDEEKEATE